MMNELELLEQLQTIKKKLDINVELTDDEYKLFTSMLFAVTIGIIEKSLNYILSLSKGDDDE